MQGVKLMYRCTDYARKYPRIVISFSNFFSMLLNEKKYLKQKISESKMSENK